MSAMAALPSAVAAASPVGKMVAHTRSTISRSRMSTAGLIRPPMSNVSAICGSGVATRVYVAAEPGATFAGVEQVIGWADGTRPR